MDGGAGEPDWCAEGEGARAVGEGEWVGGSGEVGGCLTDLLLFFSLVLVLLDILVLVIADQCCLR